MTIEEFTLYKNGSKIIDTSKCIKISLFEPQLINKVQRNIADRKFIFFPNPKLSIVKHDSTFLKVYPNEAIKIEFNDDKIIVTQRFIHFWIDHSIKCKDRRKWIKSELIGDSFVNEFKRENIKLISNS